MAGSIIDYLNWEEQDKLYVLRYEIRTGMVNEFFDPGEISYLYWQTCADGRGAVNWQASLIVILAGRNVRLGDSSTAHSDSPGDGWLRYLREHPEAA